MTSICPIFGHIPPPNTIYDVFKGNCILQYLTYYLPLPPLHHTFVFEGLEGNYILKYLAYYTPLPPKNPCIRGIRGVFEGFAYLTVSY